MSDHDSPDDGFTAADIALGLLAMLGAMALIVTLRAMFGG